MNFDGKIVIYIIIIIIILNFKDIMRRKNVILDTFWNDELNNYPSG